MVSYSPAHVRWQLRFCYCAKLIVLNHLIITVATPDTMITFKYPVINRISAKRHFYTICRSIRKIISLKYIIITTTFA